MQLPRPEIDPDGLLEYSVVFTDRSLNHMSQRFVGVMQELLEILRSTYGARSVALVPGGGSYAMESVARQVATDKRVMILRNGLFSYRWTQIVEAGRVTQDVTVLQARPVDDSPQSAWVPAPIEEVTARIEQVRPEVVFAPHVETASGMVLPDDYLRAVAEATHAAGGIFVLDCVASGPLWVDMAELGIDILVSAPQKGWSGSPSTGYVMLGDAGLEAVRAGTSTSFALDLAAWLDVSEAYVEGKAPYRATLPTDAILHNTEIARETVERGLDTLRKSQEDLGTAVRALLAERGFASVAAPDYASPTVVVVHADDPSIQTGAAFKEVGLQVAAGVPLFCGEGEEWSTVRLGLFGLDKLDDVDGTIERLAAALDTMGR
ncbi:aminotransferase class V-fold PLP-dependent enzyme [Ornithinimicrobium panacihumi]|uniref:aminotransferase class V-fold PLP-dependent enzyme n=1 Tax=Ornithinimicrobium panacihumi TaxID=2008449 RepID=UPI003F8906DC